MGRIQLLRNETAASLEYLRRAAALQSDAAQIHAFLARAYLRAGNRQEASLEAARAGGPSAKLRVDDPLMDAVDQQGVSSLGLQKRALQALNSGRVDEAEALYRRLVQVRPEDGEIRYNLATLLANRGKSGEAEREYRAAMELRPGLVATYSSLGIVLARQGRMGEAVEVLQKGLTVEPNAPGLHDVLGQVLASQGRLDEAIAHYREALSVQPDSGTIHEHLAEAFLDRGDIAAAREHAEKAESLGVSLPKALAKKIANP